MSTQQKFMVFTAWARCEQQLGIKCLYILLTSHKTTESVYTTQIKNSGYKGFLHSSKNAGTSKISRNDGGKDERLDCRKSRLDDKRLGKDQRVYYWNTAHQ
jgi:hypothetical protein